MTKKVVKDKGCKHLEKEVVEVKLNGKIYEQEYCANCKLVVKSYLKGGE